MPKSVEDRMGFIPEEFEIWKTVKNADDMDRVFKMREDRRRREWEEEVTEQWPQTEAARLFTQLAEAFTACQKLVEQNPQIQENGEAG